jgi:hypothetical protein
MVLPYFKMTSKDRGEIEIEIEMDQHELSHQATQQE